MSFRDSFDCPNTSFNKLGSQCLATNKYNDMPLSNKNNPSRVLWNLAYIVGG